MTKSIRVFALVAALVLLVGAPAKAGLIVNGGFETGNFTGWTTSGEVDLLFITTFLTHSGSFAVEDGATDTESLVSQTVATASGSTYLFSYWVNMDVDTDAHVVARWNGADIAGTLVATITTGFQQFSGTVVGTGSDTVTIADMNIPSFTHYDDVDLNLVVTDSAVPEPGTISMLALGLLAPLAVKLSRKKA